VSRLNLDTWRFKPSTLSKSKIVASLSALEILDFNNLFLKSFREIIYLTF